MPKIGHDEFQVSTVSARIVPEVLRGAGGRNSDGGRISIILENLTVTVRILPRIEFFLSWLELGLELDTRPSPWGNPTVRPARPNALPMGVDPN